MKFVNDEARSYIARTKDKFDIIQVSLIDTWAATVAGAFTLSENSLYTVEAWKTFLRHLTPCGVLTFSRWYLRDCPGEIYRLTSLACASLSGLGIQDPRNHIFIARRMSEKGDDQPDGVGTILVSREPFSNSDLDTLEAVVRKMQFDIVLSPRFSIDKNFTMITSGKNRERFMREFPINISAPTDDSPFFFYMMKLKNMFYRNLERRGLMAFNMQAVRVLSTLFLIVSALTFFCILLPLVLRSGGALPIKHFPLLVFFASIGFGFMFIEISQMQRLIVFLGHPVYGLSVVLFALLLSSGLGSCVTHKMRASGKGPIACLLALLCMLVIFGVCTNKIRNIFEASPTFMRICVSAGMLSMLGFFMGMPFPLGIKLAARRLDLITPWLWGVNGAASVCASVAGSVIAMNFSISAAYWTGFFCYLVAFGAFIWAVFRSA